jgi:hypothetical protein
MATGPAFFEDVPKEGQPLARRGLARGLRRLERAVRFLKVEGGYIDWHGHEPTIIVESPPVLDTQLPTGGLKYQVLAKQSTGDGDADWDWVRAH